MSEAIEVELRSETGKRRNRRLRRGGKVPAVLYGHGQSNLNLQIAEHDIATVLRHGSRVVDLKGAANESALISEVQWDTFGTEIRHVDFTRVSADERIEIKVTIETKGLAIGTREGGIIELLIHEVEIECPAISVPEKIVLNVNTMKVGDEIKADDLKLPEGAKLLSHHGEVVVHCIIPAEVNEETTGVAGAEEPEVIGRKPSEEGDEEE